jgi:hypothetical protein
MRKMLIIQRKYGGLGDHLFYSHIPRIAKETGVYDRVYVSNQSDFRNPETRSLVWEKNPYFDGFVDEPGWEPAIDLDKTGPDLNFLDLIMLEYGLDDGKRWHDPEIYYQPKPVPGLHGKVLYDPNFVSIAGNDFNSRRVRRYFKKSGYRPDLEMAPWKKSVPAFPATPKITSTSLEHFCDLISSCGQLVCLSSGTSHLAAALGKPATVLHAGTIHRAFFHSPKHEYVLLPADYALPSFGERGIRFLMLQTRRLLG